MKQRSIGVGLLVAVLAACSAKGGTGGGGGLIPTEDAGSDGGGGGGGGGGASCEALCARGAMANCPNFRPTECMSECQQLLAGPCTAQASAAVACASRATVTCDSDGDPTTMGCERESQALAVCALADAGLPDVVAQD